MFFSTSGLVRQWSSAMMIGKPSIFAGAEQGLLVTLPSRILTKMPYNERAHPTRTGRTMKHIANSALGLFAGCAVASLVVHRRVIAAVIKGEPLPEPPAWHKGHPFLKKA